MDNVETEQQFAYCVQMMGRAKTDSDRLAGLILLPKLLKNVTPSACPDLFDKLASCVSCNFLESLLEAEEVEGRQAAIAVLSRLLSAKNRSNIQSYKSLAPVLVKTSIGLFGGEISQCVVEDCLTCLAKLESETNAIYDSLSGNDDFYEVLKKCSQISISDAVGFCFFVLPSFPTTEKTIEIFEKFCEIIFDRLKDENTELLFDVLDQFASNLLSFSEQQVGFFGPALKGDWLKNALQLIKGILASRVTEQKRLVAFKASYAMTFLAGPAWLKLDQQFFHLIVNLSCVELRMIFDAEHSNVELATCCCKIIENSVTIIAEESENENSSPDVARLYQMNTVMLELVKIAIDNLSELCENFESFTKSEKFPDYLPIYAFVKHYSTEGEDLFGEELLGKWNVVDLNFTNFFETSTDKKKFESVVA